MYIALHPAKKTFVAESGLWTQSPSHVFCTFFNELLLIVSLFFEWFIISYSWYMGDLISIFSQSLIPKNCMWNVSKIIHLFLNILCLEYAFSAEDKHCFLPWKKLKGIPWKESWQQGHPKLIILVDYTEFCFRVCPEDKFYWKLLYICIGIKIFAFNTYFCPEKGRVKKENLTNTTKSLFLVQS